MQRETYEAPSITAIGSLRELTQLDKDAGSADAFCPQVARPDNEDCE